MIRFSLLFAALLFLANTTYAQRGWGKYVPRQDAAFKTSGKPPKTVPEPPTTIDRNNDASRTVGKPPKTMPAPPTTIDRHYDALSISPVPAGREISLSSGEEAVVSVRVTDLSGHTYPVAVCNGVADLTGLRPGSYNIFTVTASGRLNSGRFVKS